MRHYKVAKEICKQSNVMNNPLLKGFLLCSLPLFQLQEGEFIYHSISCFSFGSPLVFLHLQKRPCPSQTRCNFQSVTKHLMAVCIAMTEHIVIFLSRRRTIIPLLSEILNLKSDNSVLAAHEEVLPPNIAFLACAHRSLPHRHAAFLIVTRK